MPKRLSKLLSRPEKEKEAEAEAERNASSGSSSPPPGYSQAPPEYDEEHALDPPDITAGFSNLNLKEISGDVPQVDQTIAHLKILECFYRLRQKIGSTDGLFGIDNQVVLSQDIRNEDKQSELLAKLAEKRWAIYVSRATDRFETWSASLIPNAQMLTIPDLEDKTREGLHCEPKSSTQPLRFDRYNMPPVDVLMVWHAYMLNPRAYLEDCLRLGRMSMWHTGMPWQAAVDCINSETFNYEADEGAAKAFSSSTGLPWDNLDDLTAKRINCPSCGHTVECAITTCPEFASYIRPDDKEDRLSKAVDDMLSSGTGYCDKDFRVTCQTCHREITHDHLKVKKLFNDIERLNGWGIPMGGTVLSLSGVPKKFGKVVDYNYSSFMKTPNDFFGVGFGREILSMGVMQIGKMSTVRDLMEMKLNDRRYLSKVRSSFARSLTRPQKIGIRRLMSRYWDNSSPFALDLVGAVIRQGSFIEKMHNIDWLHSPALPSTMNRLLVKYQRFVLIMQDPRNMAVPTLDVDLAWHTHQLTPYSYMRYTTDVTRQFIDHDDKVAETKLNDAFAWTSKTYQKMFGEPYSECTCWYCEAVRESHTSAASRLFNSSSAQVNEQLHDADQDPRKSVHISTHNAVRPTDGNYEATSKFKADQLEKQYQKACERARKKGRKPPRRDDYYYSDAYGYPVYMPAYAPYVGFIAFTPMYYPVSPGCMALTAGAAGNCCQGTCGGAVAAGGCGNGAAGGCAGGMAGGCGGGGGGGFGGCGGGGGGGGGCGGGGGGG